MAGQVFLFARRRHRPCSGATAAGGGVPAGRRQTAAPAISRCRSSCNTRRSCSASIFLPPMERLRRTRRGHQHRAPRTSCSTSRTRASFASAASHRHPRKNFPQGQRPWAAFTLAPAGVAADEHVLRRLQEYAKHLVAETARCSCRATARGNDGVRSTVRECYPLEPAMTSLVKRVTWLLQPIIPNCPPSSASCAPPSTRAMAIPRLEFLCASGSHRTGGRGVGRPRLEADRGASSNSCGRTPPSPAPLVETKRLQLEGKTAAGRSADKPIPFLGFGFGVGFRPASAARNTLQRSDLPPGTSPHPSLSRATIHDLPSVNVTNS